MTQYIKKLDDLIRYFRERPCVKDRTPFTVEFGIEESIFIAAQLVEIKHDVLGADTSSRQHELVRMIDEILNGENAAPQASLCDLIPDIRALKQRRDAAETALLDIHRTLRNLGKESGDDTVVKVRKTLSSYYYERATHRQ